MSILRFVLTGGPGGGKTTLIEELSRDPAWSGRFSGLPEAISLVGCLGISPREKTFQREMVRIQVAQEEQLINSLGGESRHIILCHRGSLDPLAYWLDRGWPESEFFECTRTTREEHYLRYAAVIHMVTAADGAEQAYKRRPEAHRPETAQQAIQIDKLLHQVWSGHPHYFRIENEGCDWPTKAQKTLQKLTGLCGEIG